MKGRIREVYVSIGYETIKTEKKSSQTINIVNRIDMPPLRMIAVLKPYIDTLVDEDMIIRRYCRDANLKASEVMKKCRITRLVVLDSPDLGETNYDVD